MRLLNFESPKYISRPQGTLTNLSLGRCNGNYNSKSQQVGYPQTEYPAFPDTARVLEANRDLFFCSEVSLKEAIASEVCTSAGAGAGAGGAMPMPRSSIPSLSGGNSRVSTLTQPCVSSHDTRGMV